MMPSLFISHGSPTTMIEKESAARAFMSGLAVHLPKPSAIIVASAHWETARPELTGASQPETIHDFFGFPKELYDITYPAPGAPTLAATVEELTGAKIDPVRGLDHGAWSPLHLIYPEADIPVLQISVQTDLGAQHHYDLGEKLSPLRKEDVLIIGSGSLTHNLGEIEFFGSDTDGWAQAYEDWFVTAIDKNDHSELLQAETRAPHFKMSHPRAEHWVPVYVPMGAAQEKATLLHHGFEHKNLSMAAVRFD